VRTEINFLSYSFDRPTIEESFLKLSSMVFKNSNMRTHKAEKSRNLAGVIKEKENNKYENQIEVLWKVHTLGVNF